MKIPLNLSNFKGILICKEGTFLKLYVIIIKGVIILENSL